MRMACSRGNPAVAEGRVAAHPVLLDQRKQGLGRRFNQHGVEALGQEARSVILNEFQLLGRNIDGVFLDLVEISGRWGAIYRRYELDREGAVILGVAQGL